jgi:segregation and condensation protein B
MTPPKLNIVRNNDADLDLGPDGGDPSSVSKASPQLASQSSTDDDERPSAETFEKLRIIEALLFAASEPLDETTLSKHLKPGDNVKTLLTDLQTTYKTRGINLVRVAGKWAFRTAEDLSYLLERYAKEERKLSKAAMETMSIIAYHQPVTRAEIEEIRGVATSSGTLDVLMETGWIRPRGRRRAPGRPITYGTTETFLEHFNLDAIRDLPGLAELKGAGLLGNDLPPEFTVPEPTDVAALLPDELPLDAVEAPELALEVDDDEPIDVDSGAEIGSASTALATDAAVTDDNDIDDNDIDDDGDDTDTEPNDDDSGRGPNAA